MLLYNQLLMIDQFISKTLLIQILIIFQSILNLQNLVMLRLMKF